MQKTTIEEVTEQKTKAETDARQFHVELEGVVKAKAAMEQELSQAQLLVQQAEARRSSLEESLQVLRRNIEESTTARQSLEEHLKRRESDVQDLERALKTKEGAEAELLSHVRSMELDLAKSVTKGQQSESHVTVTKVQKSSTLSSSIQKIQAEVEAEVMQHKMEELTMDKKRAESEIKTLKSELNGMLMQKNMSEEKAQRFKELLDDSNNRLIKLQADMEADRNGVRQKLEEIRQESSELKKSIYVYQEQVKSLQRDKTTLEQRAIFHKTEVDGIKEQLKISQEKLLQKNSIEQEFMHKMRCLEDELSTSQLGGDQLKYQINEITRVNSSLENDVRNLKVCIESLQQEKTFAEQRLKALKTEADTFKEHLQKAKENMSSQSRSEKEIHLKARNLELELQKSGQHVTQLTKKVEELKKMNMETEHSLKSVRGELDKVNIELGSKDQQISIYKTQAESTKGQVKIIEEELLKVTQTAHEFQVKLRGYNDEVKKTAELELKNKTLSANIATYEKDIRTLKSELNSISNERNTVKQRVQEQKMEINELNLSLKKTMGELQKENGEVQKYATKVNELENELLKCKQSMKGITGNSEKITINLKQDILSMQKEKQMVDQKLLTLKGEFDNLSTTLRRTKDELIKVTQEANISQSKVKNLEEELQKSRVVIKDMSSTVDKDTLNLKQEIMVLQKEKTTAHEKIHQMTSEMSALQKDRNMVLEKNQNLNLQMSQVKMQLQQTQETIKKSQTETSSAQALSVELSQVKMQLEQAQESIKKSQTQSFSAQALSLELSQLKIQLEQAQQDITKKQKEASDAQVRSKLLEAQLESCKGMLDQLKDKLEKQKSGYEKQLQLVHTEMEQKFIVRESRTKVELEKKSTERSQNIEAAERDHKHLQQEIEKLRVLLHNSQISKQETQQQLDSLRIELEQAVKDKGAMEVDVLKAKSKISDLDNEKIKLASSISQLDNLRKENSKEVPRLKQTLGESERKLQASEREVKSLKQKVVTYMEEVKNLQEKVLKLEVEVNSENKRVKELESDKPSMSNHQCLKDHEIAKLQTELRLTKNIVSSYEEAKRSLEDELKKMKVSSEIATLEKDKVLAELRIMKQEKMEVYQNKSQENIMKTMTNSVSLHNSTVLQTHTKETESNVNSQNITTEQTATMRKSSLSEKGKSGKGQSVTFNISNSDASGLTSKVTGSPSTLSRKVQGLRGRISIKKLIKVKLLDNDTALKLETGQMSMEEVQACIAQFVSKPPSIAGVYDQSSKKKMSFTEASEKGIITKTYAVDFLEAQAATGCIIDPSTGETYSAEDAFENGIIREDLKEKLVEAEKAVCGYAHAGKILSVFQAMEERILDRHRGKKTIEVQIATGGLIHPVIGVRVPLSFALENGLLNQFTYQTIYDPVSNPKGFYNPETGQRDYYCELLKMCVFDTVSGVYLLPIGGKQEANPTPDSVQGRKSVINTSNGVEMPAYEAFKGNHIDKKTYLFLSQQETEWQETVTDSNGSLMHILTDLRSGRQLCIETALRLRILESSELAKYRSGLLSIYELADLLNSRKVVFRITHCPVAGLWDVASRKRLSVFKGHQLNLVDRLTALRLLEAQACTGGICDPALGERVGIAEATQKGLLNDSFEHLLKQFEQAYNGLAHPQTGKTLSVAQAMQENLLLKDVGMRCLEYQLFTGGLINPETHERMTVDEALLGCLIDKATASQLKDERSFSKSLTCPKTKKRISFSESLEKGVFDGHTGFMLLEATKPQSMGATGTFQYIWTYRHM
ncbi:plectin-like [Alosa sapidissima]|uniref:plectin-like n=1 Tax=Alosa sapidissima TaxID=34773 RepID=UPI001C07F976|nr:plectin-like [Alosa sapidissima]